MFGPGRMKRPGPTGKRGLRHVEVAKKFLLVNLLVVNVTDLDVDLAESRDDGVLDAGRVRRGVELQHERFVARVKAEVSLAAAEQLAHTQTALAHARIALAKVVHDTWRIDGEDGSRLAELTVAVNRPCCGGAGHRISLRLPSFVYDVCIIR